MNTYIATITFNTDDKANPEHIVELAAERMEQVFSVHVFDTHVEDITDDDRNPENWPHEQPNTPDTQEV